ncbi:MAG: PPC domain-containing protein [Myxococcales bacterium]|nr:PPC domain-containing protein [Myxococcales bacterium]
MSVSRGSTYLAKYFRLSVPIGTTLTIDMTGGGFDTYMYLLRGTDKNGVLLAQDDDSGPGTDSQIIYTTQAQDGTDFVVECTSFAAGVTGSFSVTAT